jgi:hypothetical protein
MSLLDEEKQGELYWEHYGTAVVARVRDDQRTGL